MNTIKKLVYLALLLILSACNLPTGSRGTQGPQLTIQNASASRDAAGLPIITVDYTVTYPSDLYAQTLPGVPTLTCTMKQTQLTRDRTFTGAPVNITGTTKDPQTGQASIAVPEDGKNIGGGFSVTCTLVSDRTLAESNSVSVDVPKLPDPPTLDPVTEKYVNSFAGTWDTNWGIMTCTVSGASVNCDYTHDSGKINATLSNDGRTMVGQWSESPSYKPPSDGGRVAFTLSDDGNSLSGDWSYGDGASEGSWTGTRQ